MFVCVGSINIGFILSLAPFDKTNWEITENTMQ